MDKFILPARKRIFDYEQDVVKDGLKSLMRLEKEHSVLKHDVKDSASKEGITNMTEVVKTIEDFAEVFYQSGYDQNALRHKTLDELNKEMVEFSKQISTDFSLSSTGYVVTQTIIRLVSKMIRPKIEAWQFVSRDLVMPEGSVVYNVIIGDIGHATTRVAEGGEYNTFSLDSTEDAIKTTGKIGVKVAYSEEAQRRAGIAAIKQLVEAALNDMKVFKSVEALHILESNAKTVMDGLLVDDAFAATYSATWKASAKAPSGRSLKTGARNGALLLKDFQTIVADTQNNGYDIDVLFLNPLALSIFTQEPTIRGYLEKTANIHFVVPKRRESIARNMLVKLTKNQAGEREAEGQYFGIPTGMLMNKQFNIIVTPTVSYFNAGDVITDPKTRFMANPKALKDDADDLVAATACTDILLVDSARALTHVHDGTGITTDKIENRLRDVVDIKFKEYYSFFLDKDHGVFALRNITVSDDVWDPASRITVSQTEYAALPE